MILSFQLERNNAHQFRYKYQCCPVRGECQYITKTTSRQSVKNKESDAKTLADHNLDCGFNAYISDFKYQMDWGRLETWYQYTCCFLWSASVVCQIKENAEAQAYKSALLLDKQPVQCDSTTQFGLQQFELNTRSFKAGKKQKTNWKYNCKCCNHLAPTESEFYLVLNHLKCKCQNYVLHS